MATAATLQVVVGADITGALRGLNSVSHSVTSASRSFVSSTASTALGVGAATLGIDALGSAADIVKKTLGVGLANELEGLTARFEAMLGSGQAAADMLAFIRKRADETPHGFSELARSVGSVLPLIKATGAPVDTVLDTMMKLAAVNPAQGLDGAAVAIRNAASGDWVSLADRFDIDAKPIKALVAQGVPGLIALNRVLEQNGVTMALVEKRAKTTEGRFSTFKDLLDSVFIEAGKPILAGLGLELDRFGGLIASNLPALKELWRTLGTNVAGVLSATGESLGTVLQTATNLASAHGLSLPQALEVAATMRIEEVFGKGAADGFRRFVDGAESLPGIIGGIPATIGTITTAIDGVRTALAEHLGRLTVTMDQFIVGLAGVPGLADTFGPAADAARARLGIPGLGPRGTTQMGGGLPLGPVIPPGAPLPAIDPSRYPGLFGDITLNTTVNTGPISSAVDVQEVADAVAAAQRRTLDSAGAEAPGS